MVDHSKWRQALCESVSDEMADAVEAAWPLVERARAKDDEGLAAEVLVLALEHGAHDTFEEVDRVSAQEILRLTEHNNGAT